jgi:hypothetical protein
MGMISALALLYVIDLLYQKYNPKRERKDIFAPQNNDWFRKINFNQRYFDREAISACTAIYIHNLPVRCFEKTKISYDKAPLAFLLKLSDCLQEWERPSYNNPEGFSATLFDIKVEKGNIVYNAKISQERKDEIAEELGGTLIIPDLRIE